MFWIDANFNGRQDEGELGMEDAVVHLRDATGTLLDTAETDEYGCYFFAGLDDALGCHGALNRPAVRIEVILDPLNLIALP